MLPSGVGAPLIPVNRFGLRDVIPRCDTGFSGRTAPAADPVA
jgi:hypothetical protein